MRKLVSIPSAVLAAMALLPLMLSAAGSVTHTVTFDIDGLAIGSKSLGGTVYSTVSYHGLYNTGNPGLPSLPVQYIKFSVPYNAANFSVSATSVPGAVVQLAYPVYPVQQRGGSVSVPDNAVYNSTDPYPSTLAWVVDEGMLAGENHVVTVAVAPVRCAHSSGYQLNLMESVTLTLEYEQDYSPSQYPMVRHGSLLRAEGHDLTKSMVVNPDDVPSNAVQQEPGLLRYYDHEEYPEDTVTNPDTYVIVTTSDLMRPMRRIAALQKQKGVNVKLVTMTEVLNDPWTAGGDSIPRGEESYVLYNDDAGKLRQYLRQQYMRRGTKQVLLAGNGVPSRDNSDLYYSELHADWLYNKEFYHELEVGRLLGSSVGGIDNYTDKLFRYELNPGNGDFSYLKRAIYSEGEGYMTDAATIRGYLSSYFPDDTCLVSDDDEIKGCDVVDLINGEHYGFMCTFNDGWPSCIKLYDNSQWVAHHPQETVKKYYLWAIDTVKVAGNIVDTLETGNGFNRFLNREYPMIYCSAAGWTMPFDAVTGYDAGVNIGESFTMCKDYGGPVYIGYTRDVMQESARVLTNLFGAALQSSGFMPNLASARAKEGFVPSNSLDPDDATSLNYLGDPSLVMWSDTPQTYSGVSVTRSDAGITVSGISSTGTVVAYHSNDGTTGKQTVTASSVTLGNVSPNSTVMLYKHNHIPYIAPLVLQNVTLSNPQYVIAGEVTAGRSVDNARTGGEVIVPQEGSFEIEASGTVTLEGGFKVEKGAYFAVRPSSYK